MQNSTTTPVTIKALLPALCEGTQKKYKSQSFVTKNGRVAYVITNPLNYSVTVSSSLNCYPCSSPGNPSNWADYIKIESVPAEVLNTALKYFVNPKLLSAIAVRQLRVNHDLQLRLESEAKDAAFRNELPKNLFFKNGKIKTDTASRKAVDDYMAARRAGFKTVKAHVAALAKIAAIDAKRAAKEAVKRAKARALVAEKAKKAKIKELRKTAGNPEAIVYLVEWLDYVNGNGNAYHGNGGSRWGRKTQCNHVVQSLITCDVVMTAGSSIYVNGNRKLKINLTDYVTGEAIRSDYDLSNL